MQSFSLRAPKLNAFSYAINAQRLTRTETIPLCFTLSRLQIVATVSYGATGSATFVLRDRSQQIFHADTLKLPGSYHILPGSGVPASIAVSFANFTGVLTYMLLGFTNFDTMSVHEFPTSIGSQWKYAVYDSLAQQRDTLVVTILGRTVLPGDIPAFIWQFAYRSRIDTQYVSTLADTVRFYTSSFDEWSQPNYVFPL